MTTIARCLKITEKVSFNIASEASYVYILSGQKLIKNAKSGHFGEFLTTWNGQTVFPDRSILIGQKLMKNVKIPKFKCDILSNFQTMCRRLEIEKTIMSKLIVFSKIRNYLPEYFFRKSLFIIMWPPSQNLTH